MVGFRILLQMHTPIIMPQIAPRLSRLLVEAVARCHHDWVRTYELPLESDPITGYQASQLILATRAAQPLSAVTISLPDHTDGLELNQISNPPRSFREGSASHPRRLTRYQAIHTPYVLFYGVGDGQKAASLLTLLDGLGREYMRGYGHFDVIDVQGDASDRWRQTPHRADSVNRSELPFEPVADRLSVVPEKEEITVWRPQRLLHKVLSW